MAETPPGFRQGSMLEPALKQFSQGITHLLCGQAQGVGNGLAVLGGGAGCEGVQADIQLAPLVPHCLTDCNRYSISVFSIAT